MLRRGRPSPSSLGVTPVLALLGTLSTTRPARADDLPPLPAPAVTTSSTVPSGTSGPDVIFLKNGGVVRGTIIEAIPGRPARIQLVTGEIWSIGWAYVDHVVTGAGAASSRAPEAPTPSGPMVRLHVEASRSVDIMGHPGGDTEWIPVCTGACDEPVPAGWEYQARGADVRASTPFVLQPAPGGTATVHVNPGSKSNFTLGIVGVCIGGTVSFIGLIVTAIGAAGHIDETVNGVTTSHPVSPSTLPTGLAVLGVGLAAVIVGGIVAIDNASTSVTQPPARAALAPAPPRPFLDADRDTPRLADVPTSTLIDLSF